ncbi:hypothetical protein [Martelella sp. HB161492]|uniref:hypothetical protein n=1 Tax=Martelella sp. HB161492 TaxID=2720726 RepID=UPI001AEE1875|nr:hypothetical protein [Martelella sp. HB161492]
MSILYLQSAHEGPSPAFRQAAADGRLTIIPQEALTEAHLESHSGLITGNQLDQDAMLAFKPALEAFLARGGRWFFNGLMVRPLVDGMAQHRPIAHPKRADFDLASINPHPIFARVDLQAIETNRGVAGFYGRGCNPLPSGAIAINGLGRKGVPVDWVWPRADGGRIFSHAGNDLSTMGQETGLPPLLAERIMAWTEGGACADPAIARPATPLEELPLDSAETFAGHRVGARSGRRIVTASAGTYYHIRSLEGPAYGDAFDVITTPEALGDVLTPGDVLWVPCRTPARRMMAQRAVIDRHLEAGGTVIALGESQSQLFLPNIAFTPTPTNWWWWLDPEADLGVSIANRDHPLMRGMEDRDVTWHLHGWFTPPDDADVLVRDGAGRAIFYVDTVSTNGRMIVSSLDPMFHHGSHFMPATTRFLDRFIPNLKAFIHA